MTKKMNHFDPLPDDVLDFLEKHKPEIQQDGDITVKDAAQVWQVGIKTARKMLQKMVDEGKVVQINDVYLRSGQPGMVWRPVKRIEKG